MNLGLHLQQLGVFYTHSSPTPLHLDMGGPWHGCDMENGSSPEKGGCNRAKLQRDCDVQTIVVVTDSLLAFGGLEFGDGQAIGASLAHSGERGGCDPSEVIAENTGVVEMAHLRDSPKSNKSNISYQ